MYVQNISMKVKFLPSLLAKLFNNLDKLGFEVKFKIK